jgi:hypothetical protein
MISVGTNARFIYLNPELIKYLAASQSKLSSQEWDRLKNTPIFISSKDAAKMMLASQLYVPRVLFNNLDLNILQWNGKWKPGSDEGTIEFDEREIYGSAWP